MKKVKITLHGTITYSAHRTFEIEVPDDDNVQLYDPNTVNDLADDAKAMWLFSTYGHLQADEHTIDSVADGNENLTEPSINETHG